MNELKEYLEPAVEFVELNKEDVVVMSNAFNGQGDYDPEEEWKD